MAGPYFVNSATANAATGAWTTNNGDSWEYAYASWTTLIAGNTLASGEIIYVSDEHSDADTGGFTIAGPSSPGIVIVSSDLLTGVNVDYSPGSASQIGTGGVTVTGAVNSYGVHFGTNTHTFNGKHYFRNCSMAPSYVLYADLNYSILDGCTTTRNTAGNHFLSNNNGGRCIVNNHTFAGTGVSSTTEIVNNSFGEWEFYNTDFSAFTSATSIFGTMSSPGSCRLYACKLTSTLAANVFKAQPGGEVMAVNCTTEDQPHSLYSCDRGAEIVTSTSVIRASGGKVEGQQCSWAITPWAGCGEGINQGYTPWGYGVIASSGTKTFTLYTTSDSEYADNQAWLEVEVLGTADSGKGTSYSDYRGSTGATTKHYTDTATAQAADSAGAWTNGKTYDQKLEIGSVAVGEPGQFRWRVVVAGAVANPLYVDPKCWVS